VALLFRQRVLPCRSEGNVRKRRRSYVFR